MAARLSGLASSSSRRSARRSRLSSIRCLPARLSLRRARSCGDRRARRRLRRRRRPTDSPRWRRPTRPSTSRPWCGPTTTSARRSSRSPSGSAGSRDPGGAGRRPARRELLGESRSMRPTPTTSSRGSATRPRSSCARSRATAVRASTPDFAAMVEVDDPDAAREFLERATRTRRRRSSAATRASTTTPRTRRRFAVGVVDDDALVSAPRWRSRSPSTPRRASRWPRARSTGTASTSAPRRRARVRLLRARRPDRGARGGRATSIPSRRDALEPLLGGALSQPIAVALTVDPRERQRRRRRGERVGPRGRAASRSCSTPPGGRLARGRGPRRRAALQAGLRPALRTAGIPGAGRSRSRIRRHRARPRRRRRSAGSATPRSSSRAPAPPASGPG